MREKLCVENLVHLPRSPVTLCGPGIYQPSREKKTRAINYYLQLIDELLPANPHIHKPCLWHGDLHKENIFVDTDNPKRITSIIDWQSTEAIPMFLQFRQPPFLDYEGPEIKGLERPRLPSDIATLSAEEQQVARSLYIKQSICWYYRGLISKLNKQLWNCAEFQNTPRFDTILLARNLLVDGEATYSAHILEVADSDKGKFEDNALRDKCQKITSSLSEADKERMHSDVQGALMGMELMGQIKENLGDLFPEQGIVRPENYEAAKEALNDAKEQVVARFARNGEERSAWEESWPFDS